MKRINRRHGLAFRGIVGEILFANAKQIPSITGAGKGAELGCLNHFICDNSMSCPIGRVDIIPDHKMPLYQELKRVQCFIIGRARGKK